MNTTRYLDEIELLTEKNQLRSLKNLVAKQGIAVEWNGREYINLSSNDYLGLAFNIELLRSFYASMSDGTLLERFGQASASSRLLTGNTVLYSQLENLLSQIYSKDAALVFNSGYHANIGILPALTRKKDLILSDKLNHASIIDGIRLSDAECVRYKHLDYEQLESILEKRRSDYENVFIVTESVFSMDGDVANLQKLCMLKEKYEAFLYVDEAHAFGVRGNSGLGICEEQNVTDKIDFIVGTFGKAIASQGAFVVCSDLFKRFLLNKMRSLIFSTALPPVTLNWLIFIIEKLSSFSLQRATLQEIALQMRSKLAEIEFHSQTESNIIPILLGENRKAELTAEMMQKNGFLIFPVRPPTVPEGTARLRISLTADCTPQIVTDVVKLIANYK